MHYQKELHGRLTYLEKHGWGPIQAARRLLKRLISTEELTIRRGWDASGHEIFYVRDLTTNQHQVFSSENDLRIWLEQRHYRNPRPPDLDWMHQRQRWLR